MTLYNRFYLFFYIHAHDTSYYSAGIVTLIQISVAEEILIIFSYDNWPMENQICVLDYTQLRCKEVDLLNGYYVVSH